MIPICHQSDCPHSLCMSKFRRVVQGRPTGQQAPTECACGSERGHVTSETVASTITFRDDSSHVASHVDNRSDDNLNARSGQLGEYLIKPEHISRKQASSMAGINSLRLPNCQHDSRLRLYPGLYQIPQIPYASIPRIARYGRRESDLYCSPAQDPRTISPY